MLEGKEKKECKKCHSHVVVEKDQLIMITDWKGNDFCAWECPECGVLNRIIYFEVEER